MTLFETRGGSGIGNVTKYIDENGNVVAAYEYDAFGHLISSSGPMTEVFRIRFKNRLLEDFGPHRTVYDDETFEKLKKLREHAKRRAREICKTGCCRNGVWIRYQFSPSNRIGVRILDWLKGNSSRSKPAQLVGGGRREGDIHVKCD